MIPERFACQLDGSADGPAFAAVADNPEPDRAPAVHPELVVERVDADGHQADVVTLHASQHTTRGEAA